MLAKNNPHEFEKLFEMTSTYCTYTQIACRLSYPIIKENRRLKKVKALLKRIINSLSKISINSNIYFSFSQRCLSTLNSTPRASEVSTTAIENDDDTDVPHVPNTVDSETLVDGAKNSQFYLSPQPFQSERNHSFNYPSQRSNSATTARTSVPSIKDGTENDLASGALMKNLYEELDKEFSQLIKTLQLLYHVLQTSLISNSYIPQLFPRFYC